MNDKAVQNKMFQKQAKTNNNEGTYSISCFSIAPSHCFRYPNPAFQASSFVLQLAASVPFLLALLSLFLSSLPLSADKAHAVILCFGFAVAGNEPFKYSLSVKWRESLGAVSPTCSEFRHTFCFFSHKVPSYLCVNGVFWYDLSCAWMIVLASQGWRTISQ